MAIAMILKILALISFGIAAIGIPTRVNLIALGLFLWLLSELVGNR